MLPGDHLEHHLGQFHQTPHAFRPAVSSWSWAVRVNLDPWCGNVMMISLKRGYQMGYWGIKIVWNHGWCFLCWYGLIWRFRSHGDTPSYHPRHGWSWPSIETSMVTWGSPSLRNPHMKVPLFRLTPKVMTMGQDAEGVAQIYWPRNIECLWMVVNGITMYKTSTTNIHMVCAIHSWISLVPHFSHPTAHPVLSVAKQQLQTLPHHIFWLT